MQTIINKFNLHLKMHSKFHDRRRADEILQELLAYNYEEIHLNLWGKTFTPKRKCLAFGDEGVFYEFSGTRLIAKNWTRLLLTIKEEVELQTGESYNFVLLNYYPDGRAKISQHADDESSLNSNVSIPSLSYGCRRTMVFSKKDMDNFYVDLYHGSLLIMEPPTNQNWKHGIPADPNVHDVRISLTFRNILQNPASKKPKMDINDGFERTDTFGHGILRECEIYEVHPNFERYPLSDSLSVNFFTSKLSICVQFRRFRQENWRKIPTHEMVNLTPETWFHFLQKLENFNLFYGEASFIANNRLAAFNKDGQFYLQELVWLPTPQLQLQPGYIVFTNSEFQQLKSSVDKITKALMCEIWDRELPKRYRLSYPQIAENGITSLETLFDIMCIIERSLSQSIKKVVRCEGCVSRCAAPMNHECETKPLKQRFESLGPYRWLLLNIEDAVSKLRENPAIALQDITYLSLKEYKEKIFTDFTSDFVTSTNYVSSDDNSPVTSPIGSPQKK